MFLIRAGANFILGTEVSNSPLEDINIVRERANVEPLVTLTLEDIWQERA